MQVSQVAYDRFVVELPPADAQWRPLADPEVVAEMAAWLWDFGPTPLMAVVGHDGPTPPWLTAWEHRPVAWAPEGALVGAAVVISARAQLERFLADGAPHDRTVLLWPRVSAAKTFEALAAGGAVWLRSVDAHGRVMRGGEVFEVTQVQPA
ncbi:MAG: hypothetical protein ACRDGE_02440 [Candidatus Limnocylindria bacterium]